MRRLIQLPLVALMLTAEHAGANPAVVGSTLAAVTFEDQHGEEHRLDESVRFILFSRDMTGDHLLGAALEGTGPRFLETHRAVYIADISAMPRLVARLFALPKMRKRPYPMLLDRDGSLTKDFPSSESKATVIYLDALRVTRIAHLDSTAAVRAAISGDQ